MSGPESAWLPSAVPELRLPASRNESGLALVAAGRVWNRDFRPKAPPAYPSQKGTVPFCFATSHPGQILENY